MLIDPFTTLAQIVNFLILVALLKHFGGHCCCRKATTAGNDAEDNSLPCPNRSSRSSSSNTHSRTSPSFISVVAGTGVEKGSSSHADDLI